MVSQKLISSFLISGVVSIWIYLIGGEIIGLKNNMIIFFSFVSFILTFQISLRYL